MGVQLSKDADALLCLIYKHYLMRRKDGLSKSDAKSVGGSSNIHETISPKMSLEDVDETCRELHRVGLLNCFFADDCVYASSLNDSAIVYMENRFSNGLKSVLDYIDKIKSAIPFL